MICSSEKRFFTSNLRLVGDWTPNRPATQRWGDVAASAVTAADGALHPLGDAPIGNVGRMDAFLPITNPESPQAT
ncbi:hypothetical protein CSC68_12270 [Pseudoxanthomonas suwonensis]|nr:hypothetical protein CSC68_12270 [Pseudoxanthomonas suwonensis]